MSRHPVMFVGAGPGDADLLTIRALRAIETAEVILYDALVTQDVLALAPPGCRLIDVGKRGGGAFFPQQSTNALMVHFARAGLRVVRLKGGDPSVFGRLTEERDYLRARGVETRTIPGVTAASAAAAQFDFSLTERDVARRVLFTTARGSGGKVCVPEDALLADEQSTIVFYMAAHVAAEIRAAALRAGRAPETPVLLIENAGRAAGCVLAGRLWELPDLVASARFSGPTLLVLGHIAAPVQQRFVAAAPPPPST